MRILDLEAKTGLERATIRFYEKEKLISPARTENGYREYSDGDVNQLLKIKLLRQLGLSVEKIKALQQGSEEFQAAMDEQIAQLSQQITQQKIAREICSQLRDDGVDYRSLDARHYLARFQEEPAPTVSRAPFQERAYIEIHPVRRFVARVLDHYLFSALLSFVLYVALRIRPVPSEFVRNLMDFALWFLLVPVSAAFLHFTGTTPGKWVMGIRVESFEGGRLPLTWALSREWRALRYGMGFGIPIYREICLLKARWRLTGKTPERLAWSYDMLGPQEMKWDDQSELSYSLWEYGKRGVISLVCAVCLCIGLITATSADIVKPKYRGSDLTVAQFASNYNSMTSMLEEEGRSMQKMNPDGSWVPRSPNEIVIDVWGTPSNADHTFTFETENGFIRRIRYENSWDGVFLLSNPISGTCGAVFVNTALAQRWCNIIELDRLSKLLTECENQEDGHLQYKNLELIWNAEPENCALGGGSYFSSGENANARLSFSMELVIHPN